MAAANKGPSLVAWTSAMLQKWTRGWPWKSCKRRRRFTDAL